MSKAILKNSQNFAKKFFPTFIASNDAKRFLNKPKCYRRKFLHVKFLKFIHKSGRAKKREIEICGASYNELCRKSYNLFQYGTSN